jgi:phosphatidylglycerophosphate synthase
MKPRTWTLATAVTLGRLAFLPVLWWWALAGESRLVGVGVMASFLGDILDGQLARRLHQVTPLGSRLDSLADSLLLVSSFAWLALFRPELLRPPYAMAMAFGLGTWLLLVALGLLKFRRFLNLHLYTGKASGVVGAIFVMDALAFGFHPPLFYLAFGVFTLGNLEGLAVMLTRSEVDEHIGSILPRATHAAAGGVL